MSKLTKNESSLLMVVLRELALRYNIDTNDKPVEEAGMAISTPQLVHEILAPEMAVLVQEQVRVLVLNTRNCLVRQVVAYQGNVNSSIIRPAEIFRPAVIDNAPSIIMAHNHPSGDPTPSPEDVQITRDLVAAGKILGVDLLDHLVIGRKGAYVSMNERKLGFDA